ncbi:hypothetical protein nbrc107696_38380 [Gordonia spumicola]|uniref:Uncharacterized protein n=1 Tax=Gordonia spumicola TaxID=589161 RepID=A0A7I9VDV2_9ACTN|nr:hypothetical protein [Gordonia spumicola]GEE03392.1 hypothetical protein nbrc107696_38380 [Gordonia spumicola]
MNNRFRTSLLVSGIAACAAASIGVGTASAYETIYVDEALYPHTDTLTSGVFDVSITNKAHQKADCTVTLYPTSEKDDVKNLVAVTNDWWRRVADDADLAAAKAEVTGAAGTVDVKDIAVGDTKSGSITPAAPAQSDYVVFNFCRADDPATETFEISTSSYDIASTAPDPDNTFGSLTGPGLGSLASVLPQKP